MFYNVTGGALWATSLTLLGYYLGEFFTPDDLDKVMIGIFAMFVVCLMFMGVMIHHRKVILKRVAALRGQKSEDGQK